MLELKQYLVNGEPTTAHELISMAREIKPILEDNRRNVRDWNLYGKVMQPYFVTEAARVLREHGYIVENNKTGISTSKSYSGEDTEYEIRYKFVDAWHEGKFTLPGWCLCEVRENKKTKEISIYRYPAVYVQDAGTAYNALLLSHIEIQESLIQYAARDYALNLIKEKAV